MDDWKAATWVAKSVAMTALSKAVGMVVMMVVWKAVKKAGMTVSK